MQQQTSSISNFKRFVIKLLLPLLVILAVAGYLFSILFEKQVIYKSNLCGAYKVHRIITETHANEMPVLGSSRAEGSYIPDSLGGDVFNYGLAGTKYNVTLFFLDEECKKKKTNPYVLMNLDLDGFRHALGDISNYVADASYPAVRTLLDTEYKAYYNIPFIKYYGLYDVYSRVYLNNKLQLTKVSNKGASLEKNALTQQAFDKLVAERKVSQTRFQEDAALEQKLFSLISSHPERFFIFSIAPYHSSYFVNFNSADAAASTAFFSKLSAMKNVKVLDFSKLPLADSMFLNTTHINYKGAKVFNHILKDSINAIKATH